MDGDFNRARKAHNRRLESFAVKPSHKVLKDPVISFGLVDLEGVITPREDALVIWDTIANYDVAQVFIDSGISVNILFKEVFDQMQIDPAEL